MTKHRLFATFGALALLVGCLSKGDTEVTTNNYQASSGGAGGQSTEYDCEAISCEGMCKKLSAATFEYCGKLAKDAPVADCVAECKNHNGDVDQTGIKCVCKTTFRSCNNPGDAGSAFHACGDLL